MLVYGQFSAPSSRQLKSGEDADGAGTQKGDFQSRVQESEQADHQPTAGRYYSGNKERFLKDGSPFGQGFPAENGRDGGLENSPQGSSENSPESTPQNSAENSAGNTKENSAGNTKENSAGNTKENSTGNSPEGSPQNSAENSPGNSPETSATAQHDNHLLATIGGAPGGRPPLPEFSSPETSRAESSRTGVSPSESAPPNARLNTAVDGPPPPLPVLKGPNVVLGSRFAADAARQGLKIPAGSDALYGAVMRYYGATFVANPRLKLPNQVIFDKSSEVNSYQKTLPLKRARLGRYSVCLQEEALTALQAAQKEALQNRLTISPVGDIASLRSYQDTTYIWHKYLEKGLLYWVSKHKLTEREARAILASPMKKQLNAVLALESKGYYLHANHIHSILNLAAPPGCSQHISGLALDVVEHQNWRVRSILNKHGWFQTVAHDFPHFIYLGREAKELPSLGLTPLVSDGRQFWVPDIPVLQAFSGSAPH